MTFGEKLQQLRQKAGMSQDALSERLGVSRQAVSRWERDETMPETDKVVAMADLFSVTTDYLLRPDREEEPKAAGTACGAAAPREGGRDILERLGYLARTKGYLLGWVLIGWGVLDLVVLLLMGLGMLNFMIW
ncbi:helix-turn-helix domain-containing protein [uncultured Oscillibacter sp.]|uniref:helix-turn-helix domain-containing protein n=1 Tax=uncultured Oscillibacter sp. TaxID=876091 RepID=UPI0025DD96A0|nr:helix-turn-helix transcriptional regulator [uncultured Oscillibacter sp.]